MRKLKIFILSARATKPLYSDDTSFRASLKKKTKMTYDLYISFTNQHQQIPFLSLIVFVLS